MKILFSSYTFFPNVGGIESVSEILSERFAEAGHEVHVITQTRGEGDVEHQTRYRLTRRPSLWKLFRLLCRCDILFQNNISLRSLIPALLLRKPVVVVHQTWLRRHNGMIGWNNRLKQLLLSRATNVGISRAILDHIQSSSCVIGNPYDDETFRMLSNISRDKTLVFLGRLVSDKGADLILQALKLLYDEDHLTPDLTVIGTGPEEYALQRLAAELGLDRQVTFVGQKSGPELAALLNRHHILVVPSRWPEPFGIVALEGIACGCVVVGSADGGLKDVIGPCGVTFPNGDHRALAGQLKDLLLHQEKVAQLREECSSHLSKFRSDTVASAYLELIKKAVA